MKNKGLFFVLMGLVLSLMLLGFAFKINSQYLEAEKKSFASNAVDQVKYKYSNIGFIKDFYRTGTTKTYFERLVPFTYSIEERTVSFTQKLPLKEVQTKSFFDFINAYEIFAESSDSAIYDLIEVEVEAPKNSLWGGIDENINLIIKPQCQKYTLTDYNSMHFHGSNECEENFDIDLIRKIDINISVSSSEDYNFLSCDYGGDQNCYQESYNPMQLSPFIEVNLLDENCSECDLNSDTRKTSKHFDSTSDHEITFLCVGAGCNSEEIKIFFNENNVEIRHSGTQIQAKVQFLFTSEIEEIKLNDLNITLTDSRFNIEKTNK